MAIKLDKQFTQDVLNIVDLIPYGRVTTYGQIARMICRPRNARLVGKALGKFGGCGKHPCHRVVTANGRLAPGWIDQRPMLEAEGVPFKDATHVTFENAFGVASSSRNLAPWPIPRHAAVQRQTKNGYVQVKYTWVAAGWHYEARWHSRVPIAQIITYPSWQLDRVHPGKGYGKDAAPRRAQTLVGDHWLATSRVRYFIQRAANNPTPAAQGFVRAVHPPAVVTYFPGNNQEGPLND